MTSRILRTVFLTSVFAYVGFAYLDTLEPGVVSDVMSVHLWLLPVAVSGVWWAVVSTGEDTPRRGAAGIVGIVAAVLLGLVFGGLVWHNGDMFGDFRLLLALGAAGLPAVGYLSLRND